MVQCSIFHEEEEKSKAIKAAIGSLFLFSSVDLVAAQPIESIFFFLFKQLTSFFPSSLTFPFSPPLNCLSVGYVPL